MYFDQIEKLKSFYAEYSKADLSALDEIYAETVFFKDPVHKIEGLEALRNYFEHGRKGLISCRFDFQPAAVMDANVTLEWSMHFNHSRLKGGELRVDGCSVLSFCPSRQLVLRHTDYFDLGAMLYENIPVLGGLVRRVKRHAGEVS